MPASRTARQAVERLKSFIFRQGNLDAAELERCLYIYRDREAVRHLFRVTASLDSLVMGEPQILGQVKEAYRRAVDHRATGVLLNRLVHHAFRTAKRVRTETGIAGNAVSVSYAAVELAKKIFGGLQGKTILLIGAGEMSELAARHLLRQGVERIHDRQPDLCPGRGDGGGVPGGRPWPSSGFPRSCRRWIS